MMVARAKHNFQFPRDKQVGNFSRVNYEFATNYLIKLDQKETFQSPKPDHLRDSGIYVFGMYQVTVLIAAIVASSLVDKPEWELSNVVITDILITLCVSPTL